MAKIPSHYMIMLEFDSSTDLSADNICNLIWSQYDTDNIEVQMVEISYDD